MTNVISVWKPMNNRNDRTRNPRPVIIILSAMFSIAIMAAAISAATVQSMGLALYLSRNSGQMHSICHASSDTSFAVPPRAKNDTPTLSSRSGYALSVSD